MISTSISILGTYKNGTYDQYYGDSGRAVKTPSYNIEEILNSPTNKAIQKLPNSLKITQDIIEERRKVLDISSCRTDLPEYSQKCLEFCLFDLEKDPCETTNLVHDNSTSDVVTYLKTRLSEFWKDFLPQTNKNVTIQSDTANCNNTWYTWLDGIESCVLSR